MAGNNSPWQGDNKSGGASVEAEEEKPKFSGDDMEFESFMFNSGELPVLSHAAAVGGTSPATFMPANATLDSMSPPAHMGEMPRQASGPLAVEQPAMEQETVFADPGLPADMPAFSFDESSPAESVAMAAGGPVEVEPIPATDQRPSATDIAGEDVPLPFHLQTSEPGIPPFVPEVPVQSLRPRQRSTSALPTISTGPLDQESPSISSMPAMSHDSSSLRAADVMASDGWTDDSLVAVEDFSSVLLALQAGSHFPLTTGSASVLEAQPAGNFDAPSTQYEPTPQAIYHDEAPPQQATSHEPDFQFEPQAQLEQVEAAGRPLEMPVEMPVEMMDDGAAMQESMNEPSALSMESGAAVFDTPESAAPQVELPQEPALMAEASMPAMSAAVAIPAEPTEIEEGQFKGSDFEFESFMFTSPATASQEQEVVPAPAVTSQSAGNDAPAPSTGALPFWLQTGELPALPDNQDASPAPVALPPFEAAMAEMKAEAAHLVMESAPTLESTQQPDYADLPPIDPFDFSLLGDVEEEESLGFNLQELEGMIPADRVSTKVTTDLSALAEFLGTKPEVDQRHYQVSEETPEVQQQAAPEDTAQEAKSTAASQTELEPGPTPGKDKGKGTTVLGKGTTGLRSQADDAVRPPSWTSTVTSSLSAETREQVEMQAAEAAQEVRVEPEVMQAVEAPVVEMPVAEEMEQESEHEAEQVSMPVVEALAEHHEIEIDPFNYTELDLDDEETATEQLSSMATSAITSTSVLDTGGQPTTPVLKPQASYGQDLSSGIPLDTGSFDDENETSFFNSAQPTSKVGAKATGWLSDTEGTASMQGQPASETKPKSGSKARVARGSTKDARERKLLDADVDFDADAGVNADAIMGVPDSGPTATAVPEQAGQPAAQAASPATDRQKPNYITSGPLPAMEGFEALHELAERNPDDLSTQMALASAYAQSGEYDAALRTYRRALKKKTMSLAMLEVIADELSDLEAEASDLPRFHQVLGDLYMKQGRYKDAIEEYNKIG